MKIEYFGHSCFRVTDKNGVSWLSDPYTGVGYALPAHLTADFVTVSHGHFDHNAMHLVDCKSVINKVGKFETNGVSLQGIRTWHDEKGGALRGENIVYLVEMDGLILCHLGDIGQQLDKEFLQALGAVDILMIPIGGTYTIDAVQAKACVDAIEPKIVLPMHYKPLDGTIDITDEKPFLLLCSHVKHIGAKAYWLSEEDTKANDTRVLFMERICEQA